MKIAILGDHHLGYQRFEIDSYIQTEKAIIDASQKTDVILCAGDIFDIKIPKLETIKNAIEIFKKASIPIFAIHGNHERRSKDMVNPVQLLDTANQVKVLHGESVAFEKNGERIQIFGLGSVPEEYAVVALKKSLEKYTKKDDAFNVLMIHQSIKELMPGGEDELSLEYLETLPFDLIVNGHIHETMVKLGGKLLIPGSTVITQMKKTETSPKGYFIYDTYTKKHEFVDIGTRPFFYEILEFKDAGEYEVKDAIKKKVDEIKNKSPTALLTIKIDGTLKQGLSNSDISLEKYENVFLDNRLNIQSLAASMERIKDLRKENLPIKEIALKELRSKTEGKITLFDTEEMFEKLLQGTDETLEYLENKQKKQE
ncbi:DNA repair exonuclease [Candidatus Micrarchaeota archaeon]|nr:DNA repair exonuclease [Candidatus Micrarchaeota archaeon]MBU1166563.1 DNA repair exonuclease [Candidatus Micrarchaeota archaeon]MBU1887004.1 DNA repair exonuclease [Candidatus Micrarchaeota archaeon]